MAHVDENDAGFRISALKHGATAMKSPTAAMLEKIVEDEVLAAGVNNAPVGRPVDRIDARAVFRCLDLSAAFPETTAAAACTSEFTEADGGSGSHAVSPMVPRGWTDNQGRNQGGFNLEQEFRMKGSTLSESVSV